MIERQEKPAELLAEIWQAGVRAVRGDVAVRTALRERPVEVPDLIIAVGKAAAPMARAAREALGPVETLVITKDGHLDGIAEEPGVTARETAHPVPDDRSLAAGVLILERIVALGPGSRLLLLVSGGGSSLAEAPVPGVGLEEIRALNAELLASGKPIGEMNAARRRVSRLKGGGLLARFGGARVDVLAISDVEGDAIGTIASGIGAPPEEGGAEVEVRIVASNAVMRAAAETHAAELGLTVLSNEETLYTDVAEAAARLGAELRDGPHGLRIFGGEPTVRLPEAPGEGGRNQALALHLARDIRGVSGAYALVAGSDGTDGPTEAAGGLVDGETWAEGAAEALEAADSGSFLRRRGALFTSGPTGTNVMDLALLLRL